MEAQDSSWKVPEDQKSKANVIKADCVGGKYEMYIRNWKDFLGNEHACFKKRGNQSILIKVSINDFRILSVIGVGEISKGLLVKLKIAEVYYALKMFNKKQFRDNRVLQAVLNEKLILESVRIPFALRMEFFFQDRKHLYFILPLALGGSMRKYLDETGALDEQESAFYVAQIVLALEYLHYIKIVYRNLKPENILIDYNGYLKICDFIYCKILVGNRTYTMCGNATYMAPEMNLKKGYGLGVDWWALGVVTFEMCAGHIPFPKIKSVGAVDAMVYGELEYPSQFSSSLQDLIYYLLQVDETRRYGNLKRGVNSIKDHRWFRHVRWLPLLNRKLKVPMQPVCSLISKRPLHLDSIDANDVGQLWSIKYVKK